MRTENIEEVGNGAAQQKSGPDIRTVLKISKRGKKNGWRRLVVGLAVIGATLAIAGYAWQSLNKPAPVSYQSTALETGSLTTTVSATGTVNPRTSVEVGAEISGRIKSVYVDFNDRVTRGQVLAELDRDQLEAKVEESEANLASVKAQYRQSQAEYEKAQLAASKAKALFEQKIASREDWDNAKMSLAGAEASLASAEARVTVAQAALNSARTNLEKTRILSPIDGIVLSREAEPGQAVAATMSISTLFVIAADLTKMELLADIDEADVSALREGQAATFTVGAFADRSFDAVLKQVRNNPTESDNVVTYEAVLSLDNGDGLLRPGMTADITIITEVREDVLLVPSAALRFKPDGMTAPPGKHVWIEGEKGLMPVPVRTGASDGTNIEIISDRLKAGDRVIIGTGTSAAREQQQRPGMMPFGGPMR